MQTIVYQCDTAMPAQKLPNCCRDYRLLDFGLHIANAGMVFIVRRDVVFI
jgi:hypothetical protein